MKTFLQRCIGKGNKDYATVKLVCKPLNRTSKMITMDIYFNPGVKLEAPIILKFNAYKKFRTEYRPFMIKLKEEICSQMASKTHVFYKMVNDEFPEFLATMGNMFDPCPFQVFIAEHTLSFD